MPKAMPTSKVEDLQQTLKGPSHDDTQIVR
jgi:hypothetical protein